MIIEKLEALYADDFFLFLTRCCWSQHATPHAALQLDAADAALMAESVGAAIAAECTLAAGAALGAARCPAAVEACASGFGLGVPAGDAPAGAPAGAVHAGAARRATDDTVAADGTPDLRLAAGLVRGSCCVVESQWVAEQQIHALLSYSGDRLFCSLAQAPAETAAPPRPQQGDGELAREERANVSARIQSLCRDSQLRMHPCCRYSPDNHTILFCFLCRGEDLKRFVNLPTRLMFYRGSDPHDEEEEDHQ
jgi:hypothetical protein